MKRPLRPLVAIIVIAIVAHLVLGFVVRSLHARPEETRRTAHVEFESIEEEAMAIRVALEIERMRVGSIDEIILGKGLRQIIRENLGMTLKAEGWEMIRIEYGMEGMVAPGEAAGFGWRGYADVRRERKPYTVTIHKGGTASGEVVKVEEGRQ